MTQPQRELAVNLLKGKYIRPRMNNEGKSVYILYEGNQVPLKSYAKEDGDLLKPFFKTCKKKRITLNLQLIRQLDGRHFLKKAYKAIHKTNPTVKCTINSAPTPSVK